MLYIDCIQKQPCIIKKKCRREVPNSSIGKSSQVYVKEHGYSVPKVILECCRLIELYMNL